MNDPSSHVRSTGSDPSSISSTLLERVRAHRPEAWARLVSLYGPVVYRWCRRSNVAPEDAADIVQEVFTAVARSADTFQRRNPSDSFRAWLATIARNKIRDHFRRQRDAPAAKGGTAVQQQLQQLPEPDEPEEASQVESLLSHRALEMVRVEFEERTWQAFWRTGVDGEIPADVAEDLGMSVFAVYQAKSRVLRRLRRELAELGD